MHLNPHTHAFLPPITPHPTPPTADRCERAGLAVQPAASMSLFETLFSLLPGKMADPVQRDAEARAYRAAAHQDSLDL